MTPRRFINVFPKKFFLIKFWNYLKFKISVYFNMKKMFYLPVTMDVEPTTGCNFRCTMCQVSSPDFKAKNMDLETFKNLILENKQLIKIKLQGMGEPLVNKYLFEMVSFADKFGVATEIITNGSLLNEQNINKLIYNKLSKITISIDGASKNVFEKIRVQSNFDIVKKNAILFKNKIKNKLIRPEFSAWCTVQNDNFNEAEQIANLCRDIGFDDLTFQLHLSGWGKEEWNKINSKKKINFEKKEIKDYFKKIVDEYSKKNFKIKIFDENLLNFKKKCSWPINSTYISARGYVVPCCIVADPNVVNFGNLGEESFKKIWNSEGYKKLRKNIDRNELDDFCKNCYKEYN